jgi:hypothetical protein
MEVIWCIKPWLIRLPMQFDSDNETLTLKCTYLSGDRSNRPISNFIHNIFSSSL